MFVRETLLLCQGMQLECGSWHMTWTAFLCSSCKWVSGCGDDSLAGSWLVDTEKPHYTCMTQGTVKIYLYIIYKHMHCHCHSDMHIHMHAQTRIHTHAHTHTAHAHTHTQTHKEGRESETSKVVANRYSTLTELVMRFTGTTTHVVLRCNCKSEFGGQASMSII